MDNSNSAPSDWEANIRKNTLRLGYWTGAWLVTMALATFGPLLIWPSTRWLTVILVVVNVVIGFGMIVANKRHLKGLDEMHQRIQLEAMALSLGVGLVVGLGYSMLDVTDVIAFDAEISHLVILVGLTYGAGIAVGMRRYR